MKQALKATTMMAWREPLTSRGGDAASRASVPSDPLMVTIPAATVRTGISRSELYRLLAAKKIVARKSGKRTLLIWASLQAHIEALPEAEFRAPKAA